MYGIPPALLKFGLELAADVFVPLDLSQSTSFVNSIVLKAIWRSPVSYIIDGMMPYVMPTKKVLSNEAYVLHTVLFVPFGKGHFL